MIASFIGAAIALAETKLESNSSELKRVFGSDGFDKYLTYYKLFRVTEKPKK